MEAKRIAYLREELNEERISYGELIEIDEEAKRLGIDLTVEGMTATDTLDEIEKLS